MTHEHLFPTRDDIPAEHRLDFHAADAYLVDGALRQWAGPTETAHGPVFVRTGGGLEQPPIGHYPLHDEATALEAVQAAARAYDRGRGSWPTMTVAARIERVQDFALRMKGQREPVVRLMMWEIGKSLADARREFDRTLEYIDDTIDALKDLDRHSSRFIIFVHQSVLPGFLDRLSRAVEGLRPGMPWDDGVTITPLPDLARHVTALHQPAVPAPPLNGPTTSGVIQPP